MESASVTSTPFHLPEAPALPTDDCSILHRTRCYTKPEILQLKISITGDFPELFVSGRVQKSFSAHPAVSEWE